MRRRILALLRDWIRDLLGNVPRPGELKVTITQEVTVMVFDVLIPPSTAADVVSGKLTANTVVAGAPVSQVHDVAPDQSRVVGLVGDESSEVSLSFIWVDDAGLESPPSVLVVSLLDTVPPGVPGALGIEVTGE